MLKQNFFTNISAGLKLFKNILLIIKTNVILRYYWNIIKTLLNIMIKNSEVSYDKHKVLDIHISLIWLIYVYDI